MYSAGSILCCSISWISRVIRVRIGLRVSARIRVAVTVRDPVAVRVRVGVRIAAMVAVMGKGWLGLGLGF